LEVDTVSFDSGMLIKLSFEGTETNEVVSGVDPVYFMIDKALDLATALSLAIITLLT